MMQSLEPLAQELYDSLFVVDNDIHAPKDHMQIIRNALHRAGRISIENNNKYPF
jgi:hypothetical protein